MLEDAPATSTRLAEYLNICGQNFETVENFLSPWLDNKKIQIDPKILLGGRETETQKVLQNSGQGKLTIIESKSTEESIGFISASIITSENNEAEKTIIVTDIQSLKSIVNNKQPLNIIPFINESEDISRVCNLALQNNHSLFIPLGSGSNSLYIHNDEKISLPRIDRSHFVQSLINSGFSEDKAEQLTQNSGRNIQVLRRLCQIGGMRNWPKDRS